MTTARLEAFSDGVLAIIITIMVLELHVPHEPTILALRPLLPVSLSYLLSFIYVGIYWNNHHHLLIAAERVNGLVLWANLHLLFWLSLIPFTTGWLGENHFATVPAALYGFVLLMAAVAYWLLEKVILKSEHDESLLNRALSKEWKTKVSPILYILGICGSVVLPAIGLLFYVAVAVMWFIPEPQIEKAIEIAEAEEENKGEEPVVVP